MKKYIIGSLVALTLFVGVAQAQVVDNTALINLLLRQLAELTAIVKQLQAQQGGGSTSTGLPSLTITSPTKGDVISLKENKKFDITWRSTGLKSGADIEAYIKFSDGTLCFLREEDAVDNKMTVSLNLPHKCSNINKTLTQGSSYGLVLYAQEDGSGKEWVARATSESIIFTNSTTTSKTIITSPRAGEQVKAGSVYEIKWDKTKINSSKMQLGLRFDYAFINIDHSAPNTGSYLWKVRESYNELTSTPVDRPLSAHIEMIDDVTDKTVGISPTFNIVRAETFLNLDRVKFTRDTGVLDVSWKYSGISRPTERFVGISLVKPDVVVSSDTASYVDLKSAKLTNGKASFDIDDYARTLGKKIQGEYQVRIDCEGLTGSPCEADGYDLETIKI